MIVMWFVMRNVINLKHVSIDDYNYYISNFSQEIKVPRTKQVGVEQVSYATVELVKVSFDIKTDFGRDVIFSPKYRIALFDRWSQHPVVEELDPLHNSR